MESREQAEELASSIIATAARANLGTHAIITDMHEVLGTTAGNAVEIDEAMRFLKDERRESRLNEVVLALGAEMLVVGGIETDRELARARCEDAVTSGNAAKVFGRMTAALGGPADFVENHAKYLPQAPVVRPVHADGVLAEVDARAVGNAIIELGGGRRQVGETLDLSVGFTQIAAAGTRIDSGRPLAVIHAATEADADVAERNLLAACTLSEEAPEPRPVIYGILEAGDRL
jgi:thymidine phosphorylase